MRTFTMLPFAVYLAFSLLDTDDDDYEHFGFMGSKIAPTLDALAAAGTVFTTVHCPTPLCRPSLASRMPHQHEQTPNHSLFRLRAWAPVIDRGVCKGGNGFGVHYLYVMRI